MLHLEIRVKLSIGYLLRNILKMGGLPVKKLFYSIIGGRWSYSGFPSGKSGKRMELDKFIWLDHCSVDAFAKHHLCNEIP